MLRAALKSIRGHRARLILTGMAIVSGVAFVAGTFMLTDTIRTAFDDVFGELNAGIDVSVRAEAAFTGDTGATGGRGRISEDLLETVRAAPGVAEAEGAVAGFAMFLDKQGEAIAPPGPPTLGVNWSLSERLSPAEIRAGRPPEGPGEVVMDAFTAEENGYAVGDTVRILTIFPVEEFTVVGILGFGELDNLLGATVAAFELDEAQRLLDAEGLFDTIDVAASAGVSQEELQQSISAVLPSGVEAITNEALNQETSDTVAGFVDIFNIFLLVFAGIAVFVGAFIIANTFSIVVSQRTRELALLRAIGASGGQVTRMVLIESLVVGIVASIVGIVAGVAVAVMLKGAFAALGSDLPATGLVLQARTVIVGLVVGIVVTVLASLLPARTAASVPPVAAMRDMTYDPKEVGGRRAIIGTAFVAVGVVVMLIGLFADVGGASILLALLGVGVLLIFLGVAFLSPLIASRMARIVGWPARRLLGMTGKLARENASRRPVRTAATAAALMVGVALVSFAFVFTESLRASTGEVIDQAVAADVVISPPLGGPPMPVISPQLARELEALPEFSVATGVKSGEIQIDGSSRFINGVDPDRILAVTNANFVAGGIEGLQDGGVMVHVDTAEEEGWVLGDVLEIEFAATGIQELAIVGIYDAEEAVVGNYNIGTSTFEANFTDTLDGIVFANVADGVTAEQADEVLAAFEADYPNLEFQSQAEFRQSAEDSLNQLLAIVTVLLALALLIALLGIANTLALSVFERTREIGLLRAVGLSRRQTRQMIRYEALIVAAFGALMGLGLGIFFGFVVVRAAASVGFTAFAVPGFSLVVLFVLATLAGVLAAASPARRAAKLNVLEAIAYE